MPTFYVSSRTVRQPDPPKRRPSRARQRLSAIRQYVTGISVVGILFGLSLTVFHSQLLFILLPVGLSLAITAITARSQLYSPSAVLLRVCLAFLYFGGITGWELLTHATTTAEIIVVTTTLATAVILDPVRAYAQTFLEERFHLRHDATIARIEAFTSTLREEIDLDQVRERFLDVIQQVMDPQFAALWVLATAHAALDPAPARGRWGQPDQPAIGAPQTAAPDAERLGPGGTAAEPQSVEIADNDAFVPYAVRNTAPVDVDLLQIDSPVLRNRRAQGFELLLPLASQGELLGLLSLGPRQNGQVYSRRDRGMLSTLAAQMAPTLRVAYMVRTQQAEVRARERIEQELRTARDIQRTFLPRDVPVLPGWELVPYYQPAHEVGGDFYDSLPLEDGQVGIVIGDVTDKGIPAALVMTATRTMIRTAAQEQAAPSEVFARVNDLLYADIPAGMFVTCFYALLDPASGRLRFANAGHEPPYRQRDGSASELWATGMPLGMMPGTHYEEYEATLAPGENLLFYSDGLVEAHNPARELFGFPRLKALLEAHRSGAAPNAPTEESLIDVLLTALQRFTGEQWEQEDDVTFVTLRRLPEPLAT